MCLRLVAFGCGDWGTYGGAAPLHVSLTSHRACAPGDGRGKSTWKHVGFWGAPTGTSTPPSLG